ncbi:hypothetical protein PIB30_040697 [Stylosanthes scabra]|uniref:Uncharacterized protein n=1 Tax=Stylosanthes scabra TaxID=79078 RepID=A0ABU6REV1_9FABA|nr:hypothetical protein [Stylosanthes scabra]
MYTCSYLQNLLKLDALNGRNGACSQPIPRAKETLSRVAVTRTSSEKYSDFILVLFTYVTLQYIIMPMIKTLMLRSLESRSVKILLKLKLVSFLHPGLGWSILNPLLYHGLGATEGSLVPQKIQTFKVLHAFKVVINLL